MVHPHIPHCIIIMLCVQIYIWLVVIYVMYHLCNNLCVCMCMHVNVYACACVLICGLAVYVGNGCLDFACYSLCALDIPKTIKR